MTVKKSFAPLIDLLEANKGKKVSTILPQILELASSKQNRENCIKDDDGNVLAVYCYYHKQWEAVSEAEYGSKASNKSTGLNTMCKEGAAAWSKQNREAKSAKENAIQDVATGKVEPQSITALLEDIEAARAVVVPREDGHGFESKDDIENFLAS